MGLHCSSIEWRAQRLGLFIKIVNSPPDSYLHVALIAMREFQTSWYKDALADFNRVFPGISLSVVQGMT
eukprot:8160058-Karenia_brevis.AAC.1